MRARIRQGDTLACEWNGRDSGIQLHATQYDRRGMLQGHALTEILHLS